MTRTEDKPKEECGLFAVHGLSEAAKYVSLGLNFLQHRGQESCGIVSTDGVSLYKQVGLGLVTDFFNDEKIAYLQGSSAIGHVRYSTTGSPTLVNAQPITASTSKGALAVAHNGNITNANKIRHELIQKGKIFHSTSDSEVIIHLISEAPHKNLTDAARWAFSRLEGAFSTIIMSKDLIIGLRDPSGFRPLVLGQIGQTIEGLPGTMALASEDSAFSIVEAKRIREIKPNEMLIIKDTGMESREILTPAPPVKQCIFELIYFAKPSSTLFNKSVYEYRYEVGKRLAREHPVDADFVVPVPDSGIVSALGYSHESGIPMALGLIRSHYMGRTFIEPSQKIRDFGVKMKFIPVPEIIKGKRIILLDDSIVRGTTSKKIVSLLKSYGATEIHFRVSSPPIKNPCYYGIDFSTREELLANKFQTMEEIAQYIGVDSIGYVSVEGLFAGKDMDANLFCQACFTGNYPTKLNKFSKAGFENDIKQRSFYRKNGFQ